MGENFAGPLSLWMMMMTHFSAIHLLGGVADPSPLVPQALLGGRPVIEFFPWFFRLGALELCWCEHERDYSGAAEHKAPSSWIKLALRLGVFMLSFAWVLVCAWRICVSNSLCNS
jgi:hypothetical protein